MSAEAVHRDNWVVRCQNIASVEQRDDRVSPYVLVLGVSSQAPLCIEGTALAIWDMLGDPRREADLVNDLAEEFGMNPEEIAADVSGFLSYLEEAAVVERVGSAPTSAVPSHGQGLAE